MNTIEQISVPVNTDLPQTQRVYVYVLSLDHELALSKLIEISDRLHEIIHEELPGPSLW